MFSMGTADEQNGERCMYQVIKGRQVVPFDISKISVAITKAFGGAGRQYNTDIIDLLVLRA